MDNYTKMRQEMLTALTKLEQFNLEEVLNILDEVTINYEIIPREKNDKSCLDILQEYLDCCKFEKMSDGTIKNYQLILTNLLTKLELPIEKIRAGDLRNYLRSYQEERNIADVTINKYREYFKSFFNWCLNEGYIDKSPASELKPIRCEKKQREYYTQSDLELIRLACLDNRDTAIIETLYSTGCRVSELCILKKSDIDWNNNTIQLYGKGKKHRTSYLNAKASLYIKKYLEERKDNTEYLFVSKRYPHSLLTPAGIQKILRDIYNRTEGLDKKITPHIFRHTTATTAM